MTDLVSLGKTASSLDYYKVRDARLEGDETQSFGVFAVQEWPDNGLDSYWGYRLYDVKRPDIVLKDLDIVALGAALNFQPEIIPSTPNLRRPGCHN